MPLVQPPPLAAAAAAAAAAAECAYVCNLPNKAENWSYKKKMKYSNVELSCTCKLRNSLSQLQAVIVSDILMHWGSCVPSGPLMHPLLRPCCAQ